MEESFKDVSKNLSKDNGLAGQALLSHKVMYVADIDSSGAQSMGYVRIGTQTRHRSIACKAVWVEDKPVGVLSVDCTEKEVFTDDDFSLLDNFAEKAELIYSAFNQ